MPKKSNASANASSDARRKAAAFAKAMARSEFGRFYSDDAQQAEIRRSVQRRSLIQPPKKV